MDSLWGLALAILLVFANGFFVATEFAIVKIRLTRIDELARAGSRRAEKARPLVEELDEYLSATQLGITLASLGLGWLGEPAFARLLIPLLGGLGIPETAIHAISYVISFSIITFLHIVVGELAPKTIAIQRSEAVTLAAATPMKVFRFVFFPVIHSLNGVARWGLRKVGLEPTEQTELLHSEEELRMIISSMRTTDVAQRERLEMLEKALLLPARTARELMVSRGDIAFLRTDHTSEERRKIVRETRHTRYPVVDEDLDKVVGILHVKDLFLRGEQPKTLEEFLRVLREPLYVPETMHGDRLLQEFRKKRQHMAIVVDEYGGTAGLVTVEDVVVDVLGELRDEFARWGPEIAPLPSGAYLVDPSTLVEDFASHFGIELEEPEVATVGGLIMLRLNRIPAAGDRVVIAGIELMVDQMRGPRIVRVLARRIPSNLRR